MRSHKDCLVLNADYSPIGIIDWKKAMVWSFRYTHSRYSGIEIIEYYSDDYVIGANSTEKIPAVIKTTKFFKINHHTVNFSRKNLFIRDNYTCQYCGDQLPSNQLTYDHIIPKSKWQFKNQPVTSWTNIVTACFRCNSRKGNKSLQQVNMQLMTNPYIPNKTTKYLHVTHQILTIRHSIPKEWQLYVGAIIAQ
jgi:hypothetical protein